MTIRAFAICGSLLLVLAAGCPSTPTPKLEFPDGLPVASLPQAQKDLLRVTLEISDAALAETDVVLDTKDLQLSGAFTLQNVPDGDRTATLRVYGRFAPDTEEVLLGVATDSVTVTAQETTGLDFADALFDSCDVGADGNCSLVFDANRNLTSNVLDLAPLIVEGGRAIDPAPQPIFVEASPETLQFTSNVSLGSFLRQVIVVENRGTNPMTIDSLDVGGGQGVGISLFDPFGGPVAVPRRSMPSAELTKIIDPGDELLVAVTFAPVNRFLTTAGVQIVARDSKTNVVQSARVKVIANADGSLRPQPGDYAEPDIGGFLDIGNGTIPATAFPAEELFSGQEISDAGLLFIGNLLTHVDNGVTFSMPADRAFVIDVPVKTRLSVSLSSLESDIDVAVVGLDVDNKVASVLASSRHPLTSSEGVDFLNDGEQPLRLAVVLGRIEAAGTPAIPGGLALDVPAPFRISCELSRGPEFKDVNPLEPATGPIEGGTDFTLRGDGFQPGATVTFADFRALDVRITVDPETGDSIATGRMPPGSLEVGKNPATAVVANPSIEAGGDGQAASLIEAFLYDPPAAHLDVALPDVAPTTGGTAPITIFGSFFTIDQGPMQVNFGESNSVEAVFLDGGTLTALPPPAVEGAVVLTVQNQIRPGVFGARSNGVPFRFAVSTGPAPTITGVDPAQGAADGGDSITIAGSGFVQGTRVLVGSIEGTVVTTDPDAITFTSPRVEADGPNNLSVVNPDGQSVTAPGAFTYFFLPPVIDGILPIRVPSTGGSLVVVTGSSFREGIAAFFGQAGGDPAQGAPPLSVVRNGSTSVLVTTPPLAVGEVVLNLINPDNRFATSTAIEVFEPQSAAPTIVFVDPASGPLQGNNIITVAGNDFDPDGVRVILNGVTFQLPVEIGGAAGFDAVQFPAPPSLDTGTLPLVLENGDGQSALSTYLYVEIELARIDQVLPRVVHILPGTEIQVIGEFFGNFDTRLQVFLGTGDDQQQLPLVARSDGLIIARVTERLNEAGPRGLALTDGTISLGATVEIVQPVIDSAEERNDEIEVLGADLAGDRLQTFCADDEAYRPTIADDDVLVVRRDSRFDARCPAAGGTDRAITLIYDGGAESYAPPEAFVTTETDADGDGVGVRDDADDGEPCIPNIVAAVCDFDKDEVVGNVDLDNTDPCIPDNRDPLCPDDDDHDEFVNAFDADPADPCVPNSDSIACTADADIDGIANPFDIDDTDPCVPNSDAPACARPPTTTVVLPGQIHAAAVGDTLTVVGTRLEPVTVATIVQIATGASTPATIVEQSPTLLVIRPSAAIGDSADEGSLYCVHLVAPAGTADSPTFEALRPRVLSALDRGTSIGFVGQFFNPTRIVEAALDGGAGNTVELSVLSASEAFVDVRFDSPVLPDVSYDLVLTLVDDDGADVVIKAPAAAGFALNRTPPVVNISDASIDEGGTARFRVTLSAPSGVDVSFDTATTAGTAASGSDFNVVGARRTIPAGQTTLDIAVVTIDDGVDEAESEAFTVTVSGIQNGVGGDVVGAGVVRDNDTPPTVSVANTSSTEGLPAAFVISLSGPSAVDVSFDVNTTAGTAAAADFTAVTNSRRTIVAGTTSITVNVATADDLIDENNENFSLALTAFANGTGGITTATALITDNDATPAISVSNLSIAEGGVANFVVALTAVSGLDVSFDTSTTPGAAGAADFTALTANRRTIPAGASSITVAVATSTDAIDETDETFTFSLSALANATAGALTATATIADDDDPPVLALVSSGPVSEGTPSVFVVGLSSPTSFDVTFQLNTTTGSASSADFTALTAAGGTIAAGALTTSISVATIDDLLNETSESFTLALASPSNATIVTPSTTGVINDNDAAPVVSVADTSIAEAGTLVFTVSLSAVSARDVTFTASTTADTAATPADFTTVSAGGTIAAGALTTTVSVVTATDTLDENNETLTLALSAIVNGVGGDTSAVGTIVDDDAAPGLSIGDVTIGEGGVASFAVTLDAISALPVSFDVNTTPGTAGELDFTSVSSRRTIAAGQNNTTVLVTTTSDTLDENSEAFTTTLSALTNAGATDLVATGAITDDDDPPVLAIVSSGPVSEGTPSVFVVGLSAASSFNVTFQLNTSVGSASSADFTALTAAAGSIPAGALTTSISVTTIDDPLNETSESFTLALASPSNATIVTPSTAGVINDNDAAPVVSVADTSIAEAGTLVFTVSLSAVSGRDVTFTASTTADTAATPADFTTVSAGGTIAAGALTTTVSVVTATDTLDENNETLTLALSAIVNGVGGDTSAVGTIVDDDAAPGLSIGDVTIGEGGVASFAVTLDAISALPVSFDVNTTPGTAGELDFTSVSSRRTIAAGQNNTTVLVTTTSDTLDENSEAFTTTLSALTNAGATDLVATGAITDDDDPPVLAIVSSGPVSEGTPSVFVVGLSAASSFNVTFQLNTSVGSASSADFTALTAAAGSIPAGALTTSISVTTIDDPLNEPSESFTLALASPSNATIVTPSTAGVINDNDAAPVVSVADASTIEAATGGGVVACTGGVVDTTTVPGFAIHTFLSSGTLTCPDARNAEVLVVAGGGGGGQHGGGGGGGGVVHNPSLSIAGGATSVVVGAGGAGNNSGDFDGPNTGVRGGDSTFSTITAVGGGAGGLGHQPGGDGGSGGGAARDTANPGGAAIPGSGGTAFGNVGGTGTGGSFSGGSGGGGAGAAGGASQAVDERGGTGGAGRSFSISGVATFFAGGGGGGDQGNNISAPGGIGGGGAGGASGGPVAVAGTPNTGGGGGGNNNSNPGAAGGSGVVIVRYAVAPGPLAFVVSLSAVSGRDVSFTSSTTTGSASSADFTSQTNLAGVILAGQLSTTINVPTTADALDENDETLTLALSGIANGVGGDISAIGTIVDDDAAPLLTIANASASEGSAVVFTVTLTPASALPVSFDIDTSQGTASGTDFSALSSHRTIAAGQTSTTISVATTGDALLEGNETFTATLSAPLNAGLGSPAVATGTINNDDAAPVLSIAGTSISEGGDAVFTVSLNQASGLDATFTVDTATGSAGGGDFTAIGGSARSILAGSTSTTITVTTNNDALDELDEAFTVTLSALGNASAGTTTATGTLLDNDAAPVLTIANASSVEGGSVSFDVALSAQSGLPVTFLANTSTGSAASDDFTALVAAAGSIGAGSTTTTVNVTTANDTTDEANETFTVALSAITNATAGSSTATGTITDNDTPAVISIANAASVAEGATASFTVSVTPVSGFDVSFDVNTGFASASGADFTPVTGIRRTISAGSSSVTVLVGTTDDAIFEASETFTTTISAISNADTGAPGTLTGTGTITDNDTAPTISIAAATPITEGQPAVFNVTLSAPSGLNATFNVNTTAGSAVAADFTGLTNSPGTITAGSTSTTFSVTTADDALAESAETFTAAISSLVNASAGTTSALGTINDNDPPPVIEFISPAAIHALVQGDVLTVTGSGLGDPATTATIVRVSNGATVAATITSRTATSLLVRPDVALSDSVDIGSSFQVRVTAPAATTTSTVTFDARKPRVDTGFSSVDAVNNGTGVPPADGLVDGTEVVFDGEFFNPSKLTSASLVINGGATVTATIASKSDTSLRLNAFSIPIVDGTKYRLSVTYSGPTTFNAGTGQFCAVGDSDTLVRSTSTTWSADPCTSPSCLALRNAGQTVDGTYTIDPDGGAGPIAPLAVHCDMTTDGGGYTFLKVSQGSTQDTAAEAFCIARGMRLLVPRTQAHYRAALAIARTVAIETIGTQSASDNYARILGVYPGTNGASCTNQPLKSNADGTRIPTCNFGPTDTVGNPLNQRFFIHNNSNLGEPNGNNCTTCSLTYNVYDGAGDIRTDLGSGGMDDNGHISSTQFMCDVGDKQ